MANSRYYGGGSPVTTQLNYLSNVLRGGMQDIGAAELASAKLAHEIGDPRNVLARTQAQNELQALEDYERSLDEPMTMEDFTGPNPDELTQEFFANAFMREMGKHGLKTRDGRFWGKDKSKPLTKRHFYNRKNFNDTVMTYVFHPRRGMEDAAARARRAKDPSQEEYWNKQIEKYDADPRPWLRKKLSRLRGLQSKVRPELQKTVQGYIEDVQGQIRGWKPKATSPKEGDKQTYDEGGQTVTRIFQNGEWRIFKSPKWSPKQRDVDKKGDESEDEITLKELSTFNKEVEPNLYMKDTGAPKEVDTSTKNRMDFVAEKIRFRLNWEQLENGNWKITGVMKVGSLEDQLLSAPTTGVIQGSEPGIPMPAPTNDPLGIRR